MPLHYDRIVIVGARGFIGRRLVAYFSGNAEVLALDLPEFDATSAAARTSALPGLKDFANGGKAVLINAAGLMDAQLSKREPDRFYRVNGTAVGHLKDWARDGGVQGFLHLSSETVFGSGAEPFADNGPRTPIHPYGISKLVAELVLEDSAAEAPPAIALRMAVVVGQGQAIGNPITMFCDEALKDGAITLFNGGTHRRKFIHVDDIVGQVAAILSQPFEPGYTGYNAGGFPSAMHDVAAIVAAKVGNVEIKNQESKSQAFSLLSNSDRIEQKYGFRPAIDIAQMVDQFITPKVDKDPSQ